MKLTLPRIFDATRILSTQAGQQIQELIQFCQTAFEQLIRLSRNGITFEDNIKCQVSTVTLQHGKAQSLSVSGTATDLWSTRVFDSSKGTEALSRPLEWRFTNDGKLEVTANFVSADSARQIPVRLIILLA